MGKNVQGGCAENSTVILEGEKSGDLGGNTEQNLNADQIGQKFLIWKLHAKPCKIQKFKKNQKMCMQHPF